MTQPPQRQRMSPEVKRASARPTTKGTQQSLEGRGPVEGLRFIEHAASDERHYVKKSVNMALRAVGKRSPALNVAAVKVARRLADSPGAAPRWVGKDALRELTSPALIRWLAARPRAAAVRSTRVDSGRKARKERG